MLQRVLQTLNPNNYSELSQEGLATTIKHFFVQYGLLLIILAILFIPAYFLYAATLPETMSSFDNATIDALFSSQEPIVLLQKPRIIFDEDAENAQGAQLVITENVTYYNKFYWFGKRTIDHDDLTNLQSTENPFLFLLAIFLLPAIIFWSGMYVLAKTLILILLFAVLSWAFIGAFKQSITFTKTLQVGFYASLPVIIIEMLLFPFWRGFWVFLVLFTVLFILGVLLLSERKTRRKK